MNIAGMTEELRGYAEYRTARKWLRRNACTVVFLGFIAAWGGVFWLTESYYGLMLLALGLFTMLSGVIALAAPGQRSLWLLVAALLFLGAFMLVLIALGIFYWGVKWYQALIAVAWVLQMGYGARSLNSRSWMMAALGRSAPPAEIARELDTLTKTLRKAREANGDEFIRFTMNQIGDWDDFHGMLMDGVAVLLRERDILLEFASADDIDLSLDDDEIKEKDNLATVRFREHTLECVISRVSAERIMAWKEAHGGNGGIERQAPKPKQ